MTSNQDTAEKLIGPGITLAGWLLPIVLALVATGRSPSIDPSTADIVWISMFGFLALIVALVVHVVTCVLAISGVQNRFVRPAISFIASFSVLALFLIGWIAAYLMGLGQ